MTSLLLASVILGAASAGQGDALDAVTHRALLASAPLGATRVEVLGHRERVAEGCAIRGAEVLGTLAGSGRVALKLSGRDGSGACTGWAWLEVKVFGQVLVSLRSLAVGEPLASAVALEERELVAGHSFPQTVPSDAQAAERLPAGAAIEARVVRTPGQIPGRSVPVRLRIGDLVVDATGRSQLCEPSLVCAVLPSGKRVSGRWIDGRLEVALP